MTYKDIWGVSSRAEGTIRCTYAELHREPNRSATSFIYSMQQRHMRDFCYVVERTGEIMDKNMSQQLGVWGSDGSANKMDLEAIGTIEYLTGKTRQSLKDDPDLTLEQLREQDPEQVEQDTVRLIRWYGIDEAIVEVTEYSDQELVPARLLESGLRILPESLRTWFAQHDYRCYVNPAAFVWHPTGVGDFDYGGAKERVINARKKMQQARNLLIAAGAATIL